MLIKPKKRFGQNFLIDRNIQEKIINSCELKPTDTVLEIGAGRGELTRLIAKVAKFVYALEIDYRLCDILKENLAGIKNFKLINKDVLKFSLRRNLVSENNIKIIGNIPYYITTPIIEYLFAYREKIDAVFLTVQKEFARRMTANKGSKEYGALSCFAQYYAKPKILFLIKKTCFFPTPKVDSCFIKLGISEGPNLKVKDERLLFRIIRAAFNQRRKTLRNSLEKIVTQKKLTSFFDKYGIDKNTRPEDLSLQDFANLTNS